MVANIRSRPSPSGALYYNKEKVDKDEAEVLLWQKMLEPFDKQLRETAKEYMERMGYGDQPYIVFKHNDISREHLHLVSLRVDENGHKLSHDFETE